MHDASNFKVNVTGSPYIVISEISNLEVRRTDPDAVFKAVLGAVCACVAAFCVSLSAHEVYWEHREA